MMKILSGNIAPVPVALALGSNSAEAEQIFCEASRLLEAGGFRVTQRSSNFCTAPVDCAPGTPDFTNGALIGEWAGTPEELLDLAQSIEVALGRPAEHGYHEARSLDLDLILFGELVMHSPRLVIPHPAAQTRRFVLEPLAEIAPEWRFPDSGKSVAEALHKINAEK